MNISSVLEDYFSTREFSHGLLVTRQDGINVYSRKMDSESIDSVGALSAGMIQAAENILSQGSDFSLSLESENKFVYFLKVSLFKESYFLIFSITDSKLLAKEKFKSRLLARDLEIAFKNKEAPSNSKAEFLFQNISDSEIDRLFGEGI